MRERATATRTISIMKTIVARRAAMTALVVAKIDVNRPFPERMRDQTARRKARKAKPHATEQEPDVQYKG